MREPSMNNIQKDEILKKCFDYFVKHGIENISMRKMCDETGMAMSSVYYWFGNKDGVILDATEYGINLLIDELMDFVFEHIENIDVLCEKFPGLIREKIDRLKVIVRVAISPVYYENRNLYSKIFSYKCDSFAKKLSQRIPLSYNDIRVLIDNFISITIDCIIWEDWGKYKRQLEYVLEVLNLASIKQEKEKSENREDTNWFVTGTDL